MSAKESCCITDQTLKKFWEIERCGTEAQEVMVYNEEENAALRKMEESISYDAKKQRYKIGIPWKNGQPHLPDNYQMAVTRLFNTEKKLIKNEHVGNEYQENIESYLKKGYLRKIEPNEEFPSSAWYLPHFPVHH